LDAGPGIAEADLPHLFEPLYRGDVSRNGDTGGAGLGLAIARQLIEAHGGTIRAESPVTGGAVFTATLPAA
jgi:signal transduction histidine kinase